MIEPEATEKSLQSEDNRSDHHEPLIGASVAPTTVQYHFRLYFQPDRSLVGVIKTWGKFLAYALDYLHVFLLLWQIH